MSTSEPFQQPGMADRKVRVAVLAQCLSRAEFPGTAEAQQAKAGPEPKPIQAPQDKHSGHWDGEGYSSTMAIITSQDEGTGWKSIYGLWKSRVSRFPV